MKTSTFMAAVVATTVAFAGLAHAEDTKTDGQILLSVDFEPRNVDLIEVGDFHFLPGQKGPTHTHDAPAIGYVSQGTIYYQVEGQAAQILKTGDAFFEPTTSRIMHFDNASKTEKAVFTDFNLQRKGEPFISFEKPLTEKIDRRSFPTINFGGRSVKKVEAFSKTIGKGKSSTSKVSEPVLGYVADGTIVLKIGNEKPVEIKRGRTFFQPAGTSIKISATESAKVISFHLR